MTLERPSCLRCGDEHVAGAFNTDGASGWLWFCPDHEEEVVAFGSELLGGNLPNLREESEGIVAAIDASLSDKELIIAWISGISSKEIP